MVKGIKMASGNELSELLCYLDRIEDLTQNFCHIEEYIPKSFSNEIKKLRNRVNKEWDLRYEE